MITPGKLVEIAPTLFATVGAYYNKKYKNATRENLSEYIRVIEHLNRILELRDHRFVLKPIPNFYNGVTIPINKTAFIDPRRYTFAEVVATTCHEALHLKQIQDGILRWDDKIKQLIWNDAPFDMSDIPDPSHKDYARYRELPWETDVEAQERRLFIRVCKSASLPFKAFPVTHVKLKGEK